VSPHVGPDEPYRDDPPAASGSKVVLTDTDHLWGIGGSPRWVWKSFMRGLHPLFMDPYVTKIRRNLPSWPAVANGGAESPAPEWEGVRRALGHARSVAERVDLASMRPLPELASTGYCLADSGVDYLVYLPSRNVRLRRIAAAVLGDFSVDLSGAPGDFDVEWIDVERGRRLAGDRVTGGRRLELRAPFAGDAVVRLTRPADMTRTAEARDRGAIAR